MKDFVVVLVALGALACSQAPERDVRPATDASIDRRLESAVTDAPSALDRGVLDTATPDAAREDAAAETSSCGNGLTRCGQSCVNLANDNNHCGSCGNSCSIGYECLNRTCRNL